jgi:RHS repeat-associated protein
MSWLDRDTTPNPDEVIVHLSTGQDVLFTYVSTSGGYDYYAPQPGHHVNHLRQSTTSPFVWELRTLEGWTYEYSWTSPTGKLSKIKDSIGNAVTITYNGGGQIDRVTDASSYKQLRFAYLASGSRTLDTVSYYNDGVLRVTVDFGGASYGYDLGSVTIGDDAARQYTYSSHKLTRIQDATTTIADFKYLTATAGKTSRVETGHGYLGYKYGDAACNGGNGVFVYFNYRNDTAASCDADGDCGSGEYCGGESTPGIGNTGVCFRARRCAAWVSGNEDLVGAVSSTCPTCTNTAEYAWHTTAVNLNGTKDAENVWTSYLYNGDGLVTRVVENDSDSNASTIPFSPSSPPRVTYFKYENTTYPGLVTNRRRLSELAPAGTCSDSVASDCKQTIYGYTASGSLSTLNDIGNTYNSAGVVVTYNFTRTFSYDAQGRMTQSNGPRTDTAHDVIEWTYHSNTDADHLRAGHSHEVKHKKNATTYVTTTRASYDAFGNATAIQDPNGKLTCLTYDVDRNVETTRRVTMAGQTTCTSNAADLVTLYTYDSSLRMTRLQRPLGNCSHRTYDNRGRLATIRERDDCIAGSAGHTQEFTYDDDGLKIKTEYKDATGTVTHRQETTYGTDRRLFEVINPAQPTKKRTLGYKADGRRASIDNEDSVGRTEWNYDALNRSTAEFRYVSPGTFNTFGLTNCLQVNRRLKLQDDDGKAIDWGWDDMGRNVKQVTPENGASIFVYDPAGNRVTHVEAVGSVDQMTHTFTYDSLDRLTTENYGDASCFTLGGSEIQYTYDAATGCPAGTCVNTNGRLARVKTKLWCDDSKPDDTFDQFTYFGYDSADRLVKETTEDDAGRSSPQAYSWDKNSNVTAVEAPSGTDMKWTLGSPGVNSDAERIVALVRNDGTDTTFVDSAAWYPFGPIKQYRQQNLRNTNRILARLTWDLAYRPSEILYEEESSGSDLYRIAHTLDAQGRVTVRDFSNADPNVRDAYYQYDWQSRIICDGATPPPGCSTGNSTKSRLASLPPYSASSDRRSIAHKTIGFTLDTFTYTYVAGKDQIDYVTKSDGQVVDFGWDGRGNRLYDDDAEFGNDRRDYVYDGRNNLIAESGKIRVDNLTEHDSTMVNAFDHKNRRVFKSVLDEVTGVESQYFLYYDLQDRLIEVKYTPSIADSSTYQMVQFYWIGQRPVAWVQTTYPAATVSRRFFHSDELNTPQEGWSWPASGSAARVWAMDNDAFGWTDLLTGGQIYQPLRFPGQHYDEETSVRYWNAGQGHYQALRPALHDNRHRVYDPFSGTYLQTDPRVSSSWNTYAYASNNAVMKTDPLGLEDEDSCPPGSPICQEDETVVIEGGGGWGIPADMWWFFNAPDFFVGPTTPIPPSSPPPGGGLECPPAKDCRMEPDKWACLECCTWNYWVHDMCVCNQIPFPHIREACVKAAWAVREGCRADCRDRKFGGFGGGGFGGGGAGGSWSLNPDGESLISEPDIYHR